MSTPTEGTPDPIRAIDRRRRRAVISRVHWAQRRVETARDEAVSRPAVLRPVHVFGPPVLSRLMQDPNEPTTSLRCHLRTMTRAAWNQVLAASSKRQSGDRSSVTV